MTDVVNGSRGTAQESRGQLENGSEAESKQFDSSSDPLNGKPVSFETHRKLLAEKKRRDEQLENIQAELSDFKKREKEQRETELTQKEDYKKLLELREQELNETKQKYDGLSSTIQESVKFDAFLNALPGQLPKKFWKMTDTTSIVIDPNTGEPDPVSVKKVADQFHAEYGELIQQSGKARLPNQAAASTAPPINEDIWKSLSPKEKRERLPEWVAYAKTKLTR